MTLMESEIVEKSDATDPTEAGGRPKLAPDIVENDVLNGKAIRLDAPSSQMAR